MDNIEAHFADTATFLMLPLLNEKEDASPNFSDFLPTEAEPSVDFPYFPPDSHKKEDNNRSLGELSIMSNLSPSTSQPQACSSFSVTSPRKCKKLVDNPKKTASANLPRTTKIPGVNRVIMRAAAAAGTSARAVIGSTSKIPARRLDNCKETSEATKAAAAVGVSNKKTSICVKSTTAKKIAVVNGAKKSQASGSSVKPSISSAAGARLTKNKKSDTPKASATEKTSSIVKKTAVTETKVSATAAKSTVNTKKAVSASSGAVKKVLTKTTANKGKSGAIGLCPSCFGSLTARFPQVTLCGHIFCERCIKQATRESRKCPTCRKDVGPRDYHPIYF